MEFLLYLRCSQGIGPTLSRGECLRALKKLDPFAAFQSLVQLSAIEDDTKLVGEGYLAAQCLVAKTLLPPADAERAIAVLNQGGFVFTSTRLMCVLTLRLLAMVNFEQSSPTAPSAAKVKQLKQRLGPLILNLADELDLSADELSDVTTNDRSATMSGFLGGSWVQRPFPYLHKRIAWAMLKIHLKKHPKFGEIQYVVKAATGLSLIELWLTSAYMSIKSEDVPGFAVPASVPVARRLNRSIGQWQQYFSIPHAEAAELAMPYTKDLRHLDLIAWRFNDFRDRPMILFPNGQSMPFRRRFLEQLSGPEGLFYTVKRAIEQVEGMGSGLVKSWSEAFSKAHESYGKALLASRPSHLGSYRPLDDELRHEYRGKNQPICDAILDDGHGLVALDFRHHPIVAGRGELPSWAQWRNDIEIAVLEKLGQIEASLQLLDERGELPAGPIMPAVVLSFQIPAEIYVTHEIRERFLAGTAHYLKHGRQLRYLFTDDRCRLPAIMDLATLERLDLVSKEVRRSIPSVLNEWSLDTSLPSVHTWLNRFPTPTLNQLKEPWMYAVKFRFDLPV